MVKRRQNASSKRLFDGRVPYVFPIVGVGASAGGLEAFRALLEFLPVDTGLAFVIIQHLAAGQESMLTEILSRFTTMPVHQVEDGLKVEPDNVYVIPPGSTMTLFEGALKLNPKGKSLRPIDDFLRSLAAERKTQAMGIVLSGTGTDGTEGLKAVKAEGGITFAQKPDSAQYSGMPQSAISAEAVDFILSPDKIAKELSKIAKNPHLVRSEIVSQVPKIIKETGLRKIFTLLKTSFNVDFSHYKDTVVNRRVTRRMVINHVDSLTDYAEYLGTNHAELKTLFDDMLIGVTSFFREPKTFETLKEKLLPELLKNREPKEPLRIWIPGCSTGEEAYSFAITIQEFLEENGPSDVQVQIFGTDVNEKNVNKARQGIYPKSIEADISESRLKRFFTSFNGSYQIAKFVRDECVFAKQDLTADPPFSNLDLISCRNMLIYFDSQLQDRIVPILHYALKPNGFLILGESESIGKFATFFEPVNKKSFIYTKKIGPSRVNFGVNFGFEASVPNTGKAVLKETRKKDASVLLREEVDRLLITEYVPAAMLVNNNLDILVFRGNVTPYLSPESGQTSLNAAKILRKELRSEVRTLVYKAKKENKPVTEESIRFQSGELQKTVNIQVIPLQHEELFFLVLFDDISSAAAHLRQTIELSVSPEGRENVKDNQIRELSEELESSKQTLKNVLENQEATNEELRSAMEEVQSSNEELQSTNEELETAKEELQSSNEELTTVNDELKNRNQALGRLNDNVENLNRNIDSAVVMVDCDLKIRLFTPSAQKILNFVSSDTGLPISNVNLGIYIPDLEDTIHGVITSLNSVEKEVSDKNGCFYELRIRPYIAEGKRIDGAVLSFVDIDLLKKHENELQVEKEKFRTLSENSPDVIARFDRNLRYLYVNSSFQEMSGVSPNGIVGKKSDEVGLPKKFVESWNRVLQNVIKTGKTEKGEFKFSYLEGYQVYQYVIVPEFLVKNGPVETVLSLIKDITESKELVDALAESEQKYRSIVETAAEGIVIAKPDGTHIFVNNRLAQMMGYSIDELLSKSSFDLLSEEEQKRQAFKMRKSLENQKIQYSEFEFRRKDGSILWAACNASPIFDKMGRHIANLSLFSDITERKKADEALKKSEKEYSSLFSNMIDGFAFCKMIFDESSKPVDFVYIQVNDAFEKITGLKRDLIVGMKVSQAIPGIKDANPELFETYGKVALTGKKEKFSYFLKPLNLWLNVSVYSPSKGYFAAVLEDITERKKAELEIKEAENRYSTLAKSSFEGIVFTSNGKILDVNEQFAKLYGYEVAELIGKNNLDIVAPEQRARVKELQQKRIEGTFEQLALRKDGSVFPIELNARAIEYKGYPAKVSAIRDISWRKKAEAEREIMVEFLKIANTSTDPHELVKAVADFFQKQSGCEAVGIRLKEGDEYPYYVTRGFPPEHVRLENQICARDNAGHIVQDSEGKSIIECMCGAVVSGKFDPSKDFFTQKGSFWTNNTTLLLATTTAESCGKTRNCCNREGYESIALIPVTIGENRLGLLQLNDKRKGIFTLETIQMWERIAERLASVLARTMAQEALRESELRYKGFANHFEALLEERTKQLKDSERLAAIGTVAGMVGHDIRNPLQAISGNVYLAKTDLASMPDNEEKKNIQESLIEIEKNTQYLTKIVADLQDFAKPTTPKIEKTDLEQIIKSALANIEIPENITAVSYIEKDIPKINADPTYLQRILINLSNNAIQAMPNGGKINLSATINNNKVTIMVQDNGDGIPDAVRSKIFTPLMTTKANGQGFGLAAVKRFTEAMGGTVRFETETGKGTKFIVELPL